MDQRRKPSQVKRRDRFRALDKRYKAGVGGTVLACGKVRHPSKSQAKSSVRQKMGKGNMRDKHLMDVYYCNTCEAWHIGHNIKKGLAPRPDTDRNGTGD